MGNMMRRFKLSFAVMAAVLVASLSAGPAFAVSCRTSTSFDRWLDEFRREAAGAGVSQRALAAAAPQMVYDQRIVNIDRGQRVFNQTFIEFSNRMVAAYRIQKGGQLIQQYGSVFGRANQQFGVPAAVITAFLGWRAISAPIPARKNHSWHSLRSPMTAAARKCSAANCCRRCN